MPLWKKILFGLAVGAVTVPTLIYLALVTGLATGPVNQAAKSLLEGSLAGDIRFGSVSTNIFSELTVEKVQVRSGAGKQKVPVLSVDRLTVRYRLWALLLKKLNLARLIGVVRLEGVKLYLVRDPKGHWNLRDLLRPASERARRRPTPTQGPLVPILATRVELEGAQVFFEDQMKGFRSRVDGLRGTLDTRQLPEISFQLRGRTEESPSDNLAFRGQAWLHEDRVAARVDVSDVPLERYLNYLLGRGGLEFQSGRADLHLSLAAQGDEIQVGGQAALRSGRLKVPGIREPLGALNGQVGFFQDRLEFRDLSAEFLGSRWRAGGEVRHFARPRLSLFVENPSLDLASASRAVLGDRAEGLAVSGSLAMGVSVTGQVSSPLVQGWARSDALVFKKLQLRHFATGLRVYQGTLHLDELAADVWEGKLRGGGELKFSGTEKGSDAVQAELSLDGFSLQRLLEEQFSKTPFSGIGRAAFTVSGSLRKPEMGLSIDLPGMSLGNRDLGQLHFNSQWRPGNLQFTLRGWEGSLQADGEVALQPKAAWNRGRLSFKHADLAALSQALASTFEPASPSPVFHAASFIGTHLRGHLDLEADLKGRFSDPDMRMEVSIPDGSVASADGVLRLASGERLAAQLKGSLVYGDGRWRLGGNQPLRIGLLRQGRGLNLEVSGELDGGKAVISRSSPLLLKADGDLSFLQVFDMFDKPQGRLSGEVRVSGSVSDPRANGALQISGFHSDLRRFFRRVIDGGLNMQFNGREVVLQGLSLRAGGMLRGQGRFQWPERAAVAGDLQLETDDEGIYLDNWDEVARGFVVLKPLSITLPPDGQPASIAGNVRAHDMLIFYGGGRSKEAKASGKAPNPANLDLDLHLSLGPSVIYQNGLDEGLPDINIMDLAGTGAELLKSAASFYTRPSFQLRLKPTANDFLIQGPVDDLRLQGAVEIEGGTLTYQSNDFTLKNGSLRFTGSLVGPPSAKRRGDIRAEAETRIEVSPSASDPTSYPRSVLITVKVEPFTEDRLEELGWQNVFLNYHLIFSSDPPLVQANGLSGSDQANGTLEERNSRAIASLLATGVIDPSTEPGLNVLNAQVVRYISRMSQNVLGRFYKNTFFAKVFDLFLLSPHFVDYNNQLGLNPYAGSLPVKPSQQSLQFRYLEIDAGKALSPRLFLNVKGLAFNQSLYIQDLEDTYLTSPQVNFPPGGGRVGLEYTLGGSQLLEFNLNYKLTDDLEPRPYVSESLPDVLSAYVGVRGSTSLSAYSEATARKRRKEMEGK